MAEAAVTELEPIERTMARMAAAARVAAAELAGAPTEARNRALTAAAAAIRTRGDGILAANAEDVTAAEADGLSGALIDRLKQAAES